MKKIILTLALLAFLGSEISAQQPTEQWAKHEIGVSYGIGTEQMYVNTLIYIISLGIIPKDMQFSGAVGAEYLYYVSDRIGVGATLAVEYGREHEGAKKSLHHHYITTMPSAKFYWFENPHFAMYSRIAGGATVGIGEVEGARDISVIPALHFSGVSIEFGAKVKGYIELGVGALGTLQAGVRCRF